MGAWTLGFFAPNPPPAPPPQLWGTFTVMPNCTKASGWCHKDIAVMNLTFPEGFLQFTFHQVPAGGAARGRCRTGHLAGREVTGIQQRTLTLL